MKVIKKTFLTAAVLVFSIALCLLSSVLVLAACSEKVTLRFETYGGTYLESVEGKVGTAYTVPKEPQKDGYYFEGWYLSSDFSGPPQELPDSMPDESRTYYAKYGRYPVLTLQPEGGLIEKTTHLIKPGVNLTTFLANYRPQKQGLSFGGWYLGESPLDPERVMDENDLTLTARYKADYAVNVYLQNADEPDRFERSEELSKNGSDWEGTLLQPEFTPPQHFILDESKNPIKSKELCAGENLLEFYYLRKSVNLTYSVSSPGGEKKEIIVPSRYGARIVLSQSPFEVEGSAFFGWATDPGTSASYLPDESFVLGPENTVLYGTWGKKYANVRGEGELIVENIQSGSKHQAIFRLGNVVSKGNFDEETNIFEAGDIKGRLDQRGGCLLDDSGEYLGYKLRFNRADEAFGKLSLTFDSNTARFSLDGNTLEGNYLYEFDEAENAYTGKYLFKSGDTSFEFMLNEEKGNFLKEGEEKGSYVRYQDRALSRSDVIVLDGFGGAETTVDGVRYLGSYRGSGISEKEWQFEGEKNFRFLTSERIFETDSGKLSESVFLIFDERLSGSFEGNGTLKLDGYGILGEYLSASGEKITGAFTREGNFVTLYGENTLRFTIRGTRFSRTGAEAGAYDGKSGELFLDGAGYGVLKKSSEKSVEGSYRMLSDSEIEFTPSTGETLRIRIDENGYQVFESALYGNFEGSYTAHLSLDGYGSGIYTSIDSDSSFPVKVGFFDGDFLQIFSEKFQKPRYYRIGADRDLYLLQGAAVGNYPLLESGEPSDGYLLLYDRGYGKLVLHQQTLHGSYSYDADKKEVLFTSDEYRERFLLLEENGMPCCVRFTGSETYEGDGKLILDGYKNAVYENGEKLTGIYTLTENKAELLTSEKLIRFTLQERTIKEKVVYLRYFGETKELFLEENGNKAIFGKEEGTYENNSFLVGGEVRFSYRLFEHSFAFYDAAMERSYSIEGGGKLSMDGCGNGTLTRDDVTVTGIITIKDDLILFSADTINTLTKSRAFKILENEIKQLGEEYGTYSFGEDELFLDGLGNAHYCGIVGTYESDNLPEREYFFTSEKTSFRFRILLKENETCFEIFSEKLDLQKGSYETSLGVLTVSGYGVELTGSDGKKVAWNVISADGKAFVAETPQGIRYFVSGDSITPVSERVEII